MHTNVNSHTHIIELIGLQSSFSALIKYGRAQVKALLTESLIVLNYL